MQYDATLHLDYPYRLRFVDDALADGAPLLREALADAPVVLGVVDDSLAQARPDVIEGLGTLCRAMVRIPGGEACKNSRTSLDTILQAIDAHGLCRRSVVLAVGGGAVLDVAGFAAAIAHRGVRLIRMPSTTLAQADAGVGVKNGINFLGKKNFLGAFAVPDLVLCDRSLVRSLPTPAWRDGLAEAVKVSLLKSPELFERIRQQADPLARRDEALADPVWEASAELHARHIAEGGDPFERTAARPLDFGHWAAHKLEQLTGYALSHGRAVAVGLALDLTYARRVGLLGASDAEAVLGTLSRLGFALSHDRLADPKLLDGLSEFREHLGGELTVTLIRGIGEPLEVHTIDRAAMTAAAAELAERRATTAQPAIR